MPSTMDPTGSGLVHVNIPSVAGSNSVWAPGVMWLGVLAWVALEAGDKDNPVVPGNSA